MATLRVDVVSQFDSSWKMGVISILENGQLPQYQLLLKGIDLQG